MNARIKELAEHAGGEFYTGFAGSPNSVKFMEEDFQKFAELIVRECSDLFDIEWGLCELTGHDASKVILKHFGVK
jgi:hypothetical protein